MSFEELDRVLREFGITRDAARRLYAQGVRLVDAENVECRTCGGAGYCVDSLTFPPEQIGQPCPDCTPENVESPRCSHCNGHGKIVHSSGAAPACSACGGTGRTPDNVEEPT